MREEEKMAHLQKVLSVLAQRAGGEITITDEELANAKGTAVLVEDKPDKAGFLRMYLLPDYVAIGEDKPEEVDTFEWLPNAISSGATTGPWSTGYTTTNVPVTYGSTTIGTATPGPNGTFEMKLSGTAGKAFADVFKVNGKMFSTGWDPAGKLKEISVADTPKAPAPDPVPPPEGGGLNTTDPTFANQGGSAPKESKPSKKSDVKRVR